MNMSVMVGIESEMLALRGKGKTSSSGGFLMPIGEISASARW